MSRLPASRDDDNKTGFFLSTLYWEHPFGFKERKDPEPEKTTPNILESRPKSHVIGRKRIATQQQPIRQGIQHWRPEPGSTGQPVLTSFYQFLEHSVHYHIGLLQELANHKELSHCPRTKPTPTQGSAVKWLTTVPPFLFCLNHLKFTRSRKCPHDDPSDQGWHPKAKQGIHLSECNGQHLPFRVQRLSSLDMEAFQGAMTTRSLGVQRPSTSKHGS